MKNPRFILVSVLLITVAYAFPQSNSEFIIIDEIAENAEQLISELGNQSNVYVTEGISPNALVQISIASEDLQIDELYIYVLTKPGAIIFNSLSVTMNNLEDWSADLQALSRHVTNKVIIHSEVVFSEEEGILLKEKLEEITGLVFTAEIGNN